MTKEQIIFNETQFLGHNKAGIMRRMLLAVLCFLLYFFADDINANQNISGTLSTNNLIFFTGIAILVISGLLAFVRHMETSVTPTEIIIKGLRARQVKIKLDGIRKVKHIKYSRYSMNRPKYNLHRRGKIRFYTRGNDAAALIGEDGLKYIIGTQKPEELIRAIRENMQSHRSA